MVVIGLAPQVTTPFFVFLFAVVFLRKPFRYKLLLYLLLTLYGVYIVATKSFFSPITSFSIGDFYVLLFACGFGAYVLGRKYLSSHLNNSEIAVIIMFIAFLASFVTAMLAGEKLSVSGFFNQSALLGLLIGGILNLASAKLQNFGFEHLNAVVSSQLMLLQNVFAPVFGFILYQETVSLFELLGSIFIIIGVFVYLKQATD